MARIKTWVKRTLGRHEGLGLFLSPQGWIGWACLEFGLNVRVSACLPNLRNRSESMATLKPALRVAVAISCWLSFGTWGLLKAANRRAL